MGHDQGKWRSIGLFAAVQQLANDCPILKARWLHIEGDALG